jgi:2-polyprenyl-3-methyl-5-hydroxy-6-metoxy-1,4-benzoquinol methylase
MAYEEWENIGKDVPSTSGYSDQLANYLLPSKVVLDVGCGYGRISGLIKSKGCLVFGIDINPDAIQLAQNDPELAGIEYSVQDATTTNFQNEFFDVIVEQAVLACMDRKSRIDMLAEMHRILKPEGIISVSEFGIKPGDDNRYKNDFLMTNEFGTVVVWDDHGQERFRSHNFTAEELSKLLADAGFKIISYENRDFLTVNGHLHPGHMYICQR